MDTPFIVTHDEEHTHHNENSRTNTELNYRLRTLVVCRGFDDAGSSLERTAAGGVRFTPDPSHQLADGPLVAVTVGTSFVASLAHSGSLC